MKKTAFSISVLKEYVLNAPNGITSKITISSVTDKTVQIFVKNMSLPLYYSEDATILGLNEYKEYWPHLYSFKKRCKERRTSCCFNSFELKIEVNSEDLLYWLGKIEGIASSPAG